MMKRNESTIKWMMKGKAKRNNKNALGTPNL